ncbi:hypothetical protein ACHAQF_007064 [Verticillium nonalfalfae]
MSESLLGYQTDLASQFGYDPLKVRASVYKWNSWAAIVINPNATALLQQAVETGNTSYDPTGVVQIIYQTFASQFIAQFGPRWWAMVMSNSSLIRDNLGFGGGGSQSGHLASDPLWLIFWVMTNVSTLSYSMDLAPGSYHWGRA